MAGAIILFDALIGFGLPLAFAIWQLRSVNRELERDRYKRETGELGDDDGGSAADSVLYRALTRTAPTVRRPADDAPAADS